MEISRPSSSWETLRYWRFSPYRQDDRDIARSVSDFYGLKCPRHEGTSRAHPRLQRTKWTYVDRRLFARWHRRDSSSSESDRLALSHRIWRFAPGHNTRAGD